MKTSLRKQNEEKHEEFAKSVHDSIHCKLNSTVHKDGVFVEIGQYRKTINHYSTNGYWFNERIKVLVLGNEKLHFYFNKEKLWEYVQNNQDRIGIYKGNQVKGISLTFQESIKLADMFVKN